MSTTVAGDRGTVLLREGSTQLQAAPYALAAATSGYGVTCDVLIAAPSAGVHTYKVSIIRSTGSGTITLIAGATNPAYILVEDIGPST